MDDILGAILMVGGVLGLPGEAGGRDVFPELRGRASATERVVDPAEVVQRDP